MQKINIMKERILNNLKKLQKQSSLINSGIISFLFLLFITLSIKSNGLFLKEILLCGIITILVMLNKGFEK